MSLNQTVFLFVYAVFNICSFWVGWKDLDDGELPSVSLGSILFPSYFVPYIFIIMFAFNFTSLVRLFKKRSYCKCPACGTTHKTFYNKINDLIH